MLWQRIGVGLVAFMVGTFAVGVAEASASLADIQARIAERRAALDARVSSVGDQQDDAHGPDSTEVDDDSGQSREQEESVAPTCSCRVDVDYARPQLQFRNGVLTFVPVVDLSIRTRGDRLAPEWTADLSYSGQSSYQSADVVVPSGVAFSGARQIANGDCGTTFDFDGYQLPAVPLTGLVRSLLGIDQELTGTVRMEAVLQACQETEAVRRQFSFNLEELGALERVRSWRSIR